jgi:hypothetical protein
LDDIGGDKPPAILRGEDTPVAFSSQDLLVDLEFLATKCICINIYNKA